jgi:hypothetical protein
VKEGRADWRPGGMTKIWLRCCHNMEISASN